MKKTNLILYSIILFSALWMGVPCNAAGNKPPRPKIKGKGRNGEPLGRGQSYHDLPPGSFVELLVRRGQRNINQRLGTRTEITSGDVFKTPEVEKTDLETGFTIGRPQNTAISESPKTSHQKAFEKKLAEITNQYQRLLDEEIPTTDKIPQIERLNRELNNLVKNPDHLEVMKKGDKKLQEKIGDAFTLREKLNSKITRESRALLKSFETFIYEETKSIIPEQTKSNFLKALKNNPNIKDVLKKLQDKIPSKNTDDSYEYLTDYILTIIDYTAQSHSKTKQQDINRMIDWMEETDVTSNGRTVMNVLDIVYSPSIKPSTLGINIMSLLSRHPRIRQNLTPKEKALFENKGQHTSLKEWENLIQQIESQKTEIDQIVDAFDSRLNLSREKKTLLTNFMEDKISLQSKKPHENSIDQPTQIFPKVSKKTLKATKAIKRYIEIGMIRSLQFLADNTQNVSEKNLQTIIWHIETYVQYKALHGNSDPNRDIVWGIDLIHLIHWTNAIHNNGEFKELLTTIWHIETRLVRQFQYLTDITQNFFVKDPLTIARYTKNYEKDVETIAQYIYAQYEKTNGKSDSNKETEGNTTFPDLTNWARVNSKNGVLMDRSTFSILLNNNGNGNPDTTAIENYRKFLNRHKNSLTSNRELMDILHEIYGHATDKQALEEKAQKVKNHMDEEFPTIREIRVAQQKTKTRESQLTAKVLMAIVRERSPLQNRKEKLIEVIENHPYIRDILFEFHHYIAHPEFFNIKFKEVNFDSIDQINPSEFFYYRLWLYVNRSFLPQIFIIEHLVSLLTTPDVHLRLAEITQLATSIKKDFMDFIEVNRATNGHKPASPELEASLPRTEPRETTSNGTGIVTAQQRKGVQIEDISSSRQSSIETQKKPNEITEPTTESKQPSPFDAYYADMEVGRKLLELGRETIPLPLNPEYFLNRMTDSKVITEFLVNNTEIHTKIKISPEKRSNFLKVIENDPLFKVAMADLAEYLKSPSASMDKPKLQKDIAIIFHFVANPHPKNKLRDLIQMSNWAWRRNAPDLIMDILYEIFKTDVSKSRISPQVKRNILFLIDGRKRQELTVEEQNLFKDKSHETSIKEWINFIQQARELAGTTRTITETLIATITGYTKIEISPETKTEFIKVIDNNPAIKQAMAELSEYVTSLTFNWILTFDPKYHEVDPKIKIARDILTVFRFVASPHSKNKQEDLPQLIHWAKTSSTIDPIMEVLYKVYELDVHHLRDLPLSVKKDILFLIDSRERQELTVEEQSFFDNIGKSSTLREWGIWIAQIQNKASIDRILDAFDNRLGLSEATRTALENFIKDKVHPKTERMLKLQHLVNNMQNVSDKDLLTVVQYIESYMQYEVTHGYDNQRSDQVWGNLMQLRD